MITSFDHVAITVKDLDETVSWYVENLGFMVARTIENTERGVQIVFLEAAGQAMLEFFGFLDPKKAVEGPTLQAEETGLKHISFFADDLDTMCRQLTKAGVDFMTMTPKRVVFKDLNGIVIELRLSESI